MASDEENEESYAGEFISTKKTTLIWIIHSSRFCWYKIDSLLKMDNKHKLTTKSCWFPNYILISITFMMYLLIQHFIF